MNPLHEQLARLGLNVAARYGFALAGGQAIIMSGLVDRPTDDVDLFTYRERRNEFEHAAQAIVGAYMDAGYTVDIDYQSGDYYRLYVTDRTTGETSKVDLVVEFRHNEPVQMAIGPVMHIDDLVAAKMHALWNRGEVRDFIDIYAALRTGRYTTTDLQHLLARIDHGYDGRMLAGMLGRLSTFDDSDFARYGVAGHAVADLRAWFADWRAELLAE